MASFDVWWGALFGTALGICGVLAVIDGYNKFRRAYRLTTLPRSGVAALTGVEPGRVVQVSGTVEATGSLVTAPYSGTDCALCKTTVQYHSAHNSPAWRTVDAAVRGDAFALTDDTGRVTVDASDADIETAVAEEGRCPADREAAPPTLTPLLTRADGGEYATVKLTGRDLKLLERRIVPGDEVTVLGEVRPDGSVGATQVGGLGARGLAALVGAAAFQVVFGAFLVSVLWFVALPNWATLVP